jgi:hypothetical protein
MSAPQYDPKRNPQQPIDPEGKKKNREHEREDRKQREREKNPGRDHGDEHHEDDDRRAFGGFDIEAEYRTLGGEG